MAKEKQSIGKRTVKYKQIAEELAREKQEAEAKERKRIEDELSLSKDESKTNDSDDVSDKSTDESAQITINKGSDTIVDNDAISTCNESISVDDTDNNELDNRQSDSQTKDNDSDGKKANVLQSVDLALPKRKKAHKEILVIVLIALLVVGIFSVWSLINKDKTPTEIPEEETVIVEPEPESMPSDLKNEWLSNKAINNDYIGNIAFDSGLIDLPFVQAKDVYDRNGKPYSFYTEDGQLVENVNEYTGNDVYIWTNWRTGEYDRYDEGGSVFMDFRNNIKDQNLIIYGHHFARDWDESGSKQFTPLDVLLDEGNYEENKAFKLILNNEIREYVITNVFTITIDNDYELNIMRRNMNEDYSGNADPGFFAEFIKYIDGINKYPIQEHLSSNDRIVTLVTCMQHQPELRQIIIAKEINTTIYQ